MEQDPMSNLGTYRNQRDSFLAKITETFSKDERFVAGWLTGSFSRNEADSFSDIDLRLVVSDAYSPVLCTRLEQVSARTSPERYAVFSQFGHPALIHENNNNAPDGGTFTFVLYAESAIMIDWVLVPHLTAARPFQSRLLFEKVAIPMVPMAESEDLEQSQKSVAEMWAFFWMMTAVTIKYIYRNDGVFATEWIEHLHEFLYEIERRLRREPWTYAHARSSRSQFQTTREKQLESIRQLCHRMQGLKSMVTEFTGSEPLTPTSEIHTLLLLTDEVTHHS
jgi:hypothetical protein